VKYASQAFETHLTSHLRSKYFTLLHLPQRGKLHSDKAGGMIMAESKLRTQSMESACTSIRVMLIASINTAKDNTE